MPDNYRPNERNVFYQKNEMIESGRGQRVYRIMTWTLLQHKCVVRQLNFEVSHCAVDDIRETLCV